MATTTNYSWSTPDDTALVKDGAAAIRSLGTAIDTTVFTNAGAAINKTIIDAAGDLIYGTAADTAARLALGTAGQVLTVNSGVTAPEWTTISAGGMTLLSTTSLSGATTTISAISGSYNSLFAVVYGVTNATADGHFRVAANGTTNIATFVSLDKSAIRSTVQGYLTLNGGSLVVQRTDSSNSFAFQIDNYASATDRKPVSYNGYFQSTTQGQGGVFGGGGIVTTSAITSLVFSNSGGDLSTGTVLLYGVK